MSSRSKEKMAAAFRKLFRSTEKMADGEGGGSSGQAKTGGSPARRLLNRHRDIVTPAEPGPLDNPSPRTSSGLFKKKSPAIPQPDSTPHEKKVRTRRLMKELQEIQRNEKKDDPVFTVSLVNDNLFEWHVRLYRIDQESDLAADMREHNVSHILLHITFPDNFPFMPPFMRVISPRIERGFVMEGGAICMELLTPRGWASAYTVEALIMQFAASIVKGQGRIAKKTKSSSKDFSRRSAEESFRSLVKTHEKYGWVTPPLSDG
ncbi:ubiquitin-conjugating enzyme E2Q-like protein 1 [Macrosteles quadrilineatus]|uniref:ubiquitin-conjugating enzyme E2Q-like protein 1 n=1 Tax=Macrosteles quadrilineatus TaxID=74068 RepID=UPI0023E1A0C9|nr:ubiquitin-conjugating enzyme E2Q-like protein 1 [Macrosteles quadrilineatus]XP_054285018.1 ubiquitin-conjugating enzyme E2Q-like protein 1 [Macrosteles quadrilineatus]